MPWSGAGSFSRTNGINTGPTTWSLDEAGGIGIARDRHETHDNDLATGINAAIAKNGENAPTANLPMGGFRHTNVADATTRSDYSKVSQTQDSAYMYGGTSTGAANVYTILLSPAITAYTAGLTVRFRSHQANTGTATLQVNGLGIVNITKRAGTIFLNGGDIGNGDIIECMHDGTVWQLTAQRGGLESWTPTFAGSGSMTTTAPSINQAHFHREGEIVWFTIQATVTTGGVASNQVQFTLPVAALGTGYINFAGFVNDVGNLRSALGIAVSTTVVGVQRFDNTNFTLGTVTLYIQGFYRA